jgi:cohesin domain-containing protein/PEP-CTERM motif-containing protein
MRRLFIAAVVAVAGLMVSATPARAAAISFGSTTANVGQTFNVDIWLTGPNPGIAEFAFDFVFNSAVLRLDDISRGNLFPSWADFTGQEGSVKGSVNASMSPLESTTTPATLARLTFTAVGAGAANLKVTNASFTGVNWFWIIPVEYQFAPDSVTNGAISVAGGPNQPIPTPEPGTMTLFGLGAYALARRVRRKNGAETIAA